MGADQADDFEKAILISFAQDGQVEESLKVIFLATIVHPLSPGGYLAAISVHVNILSLLSHVVVTALARDAD